MNAMNWNTLSWGRLMNPIMVGKDILIVEYLDEMKLHVVKVMGTDHVDNEHVLIVQEAGEDDISIITREFKGKTWEAYEILEGF